MITRSMQAEVAQLGQLKSVLEAIRQYGRRHPRGRCAPSAFAFALELGDVVRSLPFQLPENFLLIVRAMSLTSGMCSSLDPAFNIWNAVEPYSAQLIRAEGGNLVQAAAKQVV